MIMLSDDFTVSITVNKRENLSKKLSYYRASVDMAEM